MFLLREARPRDKRRLLELARLLDSVNMPTTARDMDETLKRSRRSFRGRIRDRARAVYMFCAEDLKTRRVAGASMIIAKHGTPASPHYYLQIDSDERYSHTLRKMFRHNFLRLRHSMDGPTEVGGLIVDPELRRLPEKVGKQLSWLRFLYIARHRKRFESRIIAEIMPPLTPERGNLFWDHYGRQMTGLSFREADRLSIRDKEFIRALFPDAPLYTALLPDEVRASLGVAGEQSRGAVRLLEQAGLRFLEEIDPFDAGPYYGAPVADLARVQRGPDGPGQLVDRDAPLTSRRPRDRSRGALGGQRLLHVGQVERGHGIHGLAVTQVPEVARGDGDRAVAERPGDDRHGQPGLFQLVRVGVAQAVRVDPLADACLCGQPLEQVADVAVRQRAAVERAEQRAVGQAERLTPVEPPHQRVIGARVQRAHGGLIALAVQHAGTVMLQINAGGLER